MFKFFLLIFSTIILSSNARDVGRMPKHLPGVDVETIGAYTLSVVWPQSAWWKEAQTFDEINNRCTNLKELKPNVQWTVHGLWGNDKASKQEIADCIKHPNSLVDFSSNPALLENMRTYYVNYQKSKTDDDLWKHEWAKHGTCVTADPDLATPEKYFTKILQLFKEHNVYNALQSKGITPKPVPADAVKFGPGKHRDDIQTLEKAGYLYSHIQKAIKEELKADVVMKCIIKKGVRFLVEVFLCFDKKFHLINCSQKYKPEEMISSCFPKLAPTDKRTRPTDGIIVYPEKLRKC